MTLIHIEQESEERLELAQTAIEDLMTLIEIHFIWIFDPILLPFFLNQDSLYYIHLYLTSLSKSMNGSKQYLLSAATAAERTKTKSILIGRAG